MDKKIIAAMGWLLLGSLFNFQASAAGPTPFQGVTAQIPGVIEAENFDEGGEGLAYHDTDAGNNGGFYRATDVDIDRDTSDGAFYVGWIKDGEQLKYTVRVNADGYYFVTARVASLGQGGTMFLNVNDEFHNDWTIDIPDTGGWRNWKIVEGRSSVALARRFLKAGTYLVTVTFSDAGRGLNGLGNVDWIRFRAPAPHEPFGGAPLSLPGVVDAAGFDFGGEGVAYHDVDPGTNGDCNLRLDGTDVEVCAGFKYSTYVGWTRAGEWLEYTVNVRQSGLYAINARVASDGPGGKFRLLLDGRDMAFFTAPDTGGWQNFVLLAGPNVFLPQGQHVLRVSLDEVGKSGSVANLSLFEFKPGTRSVPFQNGAPAAIPGVIEAVNFDEGGEGVAYHDSDPGNNGGFYRSTDVDIDQREVGLYVGWTQGGEWLNYTVNVQTEGYYLLEAYVASFGEGGVFHLEFDGVDRTGPLVVPGTGSWTNIGVIVKRRIFLPAGTQTMRVVLDQNGPSGSVGNLVALEFYLENPVPVPGGVLAADFNDGGEGVGYHDTDAKNQGGLYRPTEGVDIDLDSQFDRPLYYVGWTQAGEWLEYTLLVQQDGFYDLYVNYASDGEGGTYHVDFDGVTAFDNLPAPNTGGWRKWSSIRTSQTVHLTAGSHRMRVVFDSIGKSGSVANFSFFSLSRQN